MVQLAHRPRIQGVKRLPHDEVYVGILFSLHLCERAVLGETSVCKLIVTQLESRQDTLVKLAHVLCEHDLAHVCVRPSALWPLCNLHVRSGNLSALPGSLVQLLCACTC